jgi:hypothetical protein
MSKESLASRIPQICSQRKPRTVKRRGTSSCYRGKYTLYYEVTPWPRNVDQFMRANPCRTLRAVGAFLVSANFKDETARGATLLSEKDRDCTVVNPRNGKAIQLVRNGRPAETVSGERFWFKTSPNESIALQPVDNSRLTRSKFETRKAVTTGVILNLCSVRRVILS